MPSEPVRRKKPPRQYRVLVVPNHEGGATRSLSLSRTRLWLLVLGVLVTITGGTIALLVWTPLGSLIRIPNPELEKRYSAELRETQERLQVLAEDVLLLRDYNLQLRRALGDTGPRDSMGTARVMPSVLGETTDAAAPVMEPPVQGSTTGEPAYTSAVMTGDGLQASFPLLPPAGGYVTEGFDPARRHYGLDFADRTGAPVYAPAEGYVIFAGWTYDGGNMMMLSHGSGYLTVYKHAQSLLKSEHAYVRRGDVIALVGSTGNTSNGPHLHFELWRDGLPMDPNEFLLTTPRVQQERASRGG